MQLYGNSNGMYSHPIANNNQMVWGKKLILDSIFASSKAITKCNVGNISIQIILFVQNKMLFKATRVSESVQALSLDVETLRRLL